MSFSSIKRMDKLGRLLFPREIRREMGVTEDTDLLIETENGKTIITVYRPVCKLCGFDENVSSELMICKKCLDKLK